MTIEKIYNEKFCYYEVLGVTFYYKKVYILGKFHHYETTVNNEVYKLTSFVTMKKVWAFALTNTFNKDPYEVYHYMNV